MLVTHDARPASCMPDACFCEAIRSGDIKQPANTWSSLAFVLVAVIVLFRASKLSRRSMLGSNGFASSNAYPLLYALALLVVGFGSAFFHATLSWRGQFVDVMGMYFVATFALICALDRLRKLTTAQIVGGYAAMNAALASILYLLPVLRRVVFAVLVVTVLAVEALIRRRSGPRGETRHLVYAAGTLAVAFLIWILDYTRLLCRPDSLMQGHAVWHVLGAVAAWYLYLYYLQPRDRVRTKSP